jgi:hypothetical protein
MSQHRSPALRLARRLKQFRLSLVATLAVLALTACGEAPQRHAASSSVALGVQEMLRAGEARPAPTAARDLRVASIRITRKAL